MDPPKFKLTRRGQLHSSSPTQFLTHSPPHGASQTFTHRPPHFPSLNCNKLHLPGLSRLLLHPYPYFHRTLTTSITLGDQLQPTTTNFNLHLRLLPWLLMLAWFCFVGSLCCCGSFFVFLCFFVVFVVGLFVCLLALLCLFLCFVCFLVFLSACLLACCWFALVCFVWFCGLLVTRVGW